MGLRPFKQLIAISKEKMTELMAAPRAKRLQYQGEVEMLEIDAEILMIEGKIEESFNEPDNFSFKNMLSQLDQIAILKRRKKQYDGVLSQLFPKE